VTAGMASGMATKKYTVTLPEDLAQEIRRKVGPGAFSAYVTDAVRRKFQNDKLGELVELLEEEYGPVSEAELARAEARHREYERRFAARERGLPDTADVPTRPDSHAGDVTSGTDDAEIDRPLAA
jgi:Arc/MetJ-type ribon-helix-helix transcriptional regulator